MRVKVICCGFGVLSEQIGKVKGRCEGGYQIKPPVVSP